MTDCDPNETTGGRGGRDDWRPAAEFTAGTVWYYSLASGVYFMTIIETPDRFDGNVLLVVQRSESDPFIQWSDVRYEVTIPYAHLDQWMYDLDADIVDDDNA